MEKKLEAIDWNLIMQFIRIKDFDWTLQGIKEQYEKYNRNEYVSFTARYIITNAILPQINSTG